MDAKTHYKQLDPGMASVYAGTASAGLAARVTEILGLQCGKISIRRMPDTELHVQIADSVRGKDVYFIQSLRPPVSENLVELLVVLDAFRRASVRRLTAIVPYLAFSRQEKKSTGREPISARLVADLITAAGADRVVSVDLHAPAIQGFFNVGMDHLTAVPLLAGRAQRISSGKNTVVVAPDLGRAKFADSVARALGLPLAIVNKRRLDMDSVDVGAIVGNVADRVPLIVDDIISTGGTILAATDALLEAGARPEVHVLATHGLLVGEAQRRLNHGAIRGVHVTDTIESSRSPDWLEVASIAPLLADAIRNIHLERSISELYPIDYAVQPV